MYIPDHLTTSKTSTTFLESSSFYYLSHFIVLLRKLLRPFSSSRIRNVINSNLSDPPLLDLISKGGRNDTGGKKVLHLPSLFPFILFFPLFLPLKAAPRLHIFQDFPSS